MLEKRLQLTCTYNFGLSTLNSTGGDVVEFVFNSPSPIVDMYCNSNSPTFIASVNANNLFFVDPTQSSLLRVTDLAFTTGTNNYSITSSGTTGPAGHVNLVSRGKSVMYQGANRIWLNTGAGSSQTGLYPGNGNLSGPLFPQVQLNTSGLGSHQVTIDDSGYSGGDTYTLSDHKLRSNRLGDKVLFPNSTPENRIQVSLFTGNGNDTVILQGDNSRVDGMASSFNQMLPGGGVDTFRIVDFNHFNAHTYRFTELLASRDGLGMAYYGSNLEYIELSTGQGDDHVTVGSNSNQLIGMPKVILTSMGSGNNQVTALDTGWGIGGTYALTSDRFSAHLAGDVIYFQFLADQVTFNLYTGSGNDNVNVGNGSNTAQNVPILNWQVVGGGFNLLTVSDQGYSADVDYRLTEDRLSILDSVRNLGDRVFFPVSPLGSPLLQVNVNSGTGRNRFYLSPSSSQFRALPHFGVFDAGGADVMEIDDSNAPPGFRTYVFNEYGGGDIGYPNRTFYNQSVEVVQWYVNPTTINDVRMSSTGNSIDPLPQMTFFGPLYNISLNDSGASFGVVNYSVFDRQISKQGSVRAQFSSAQNVSLNASMSTNFIDLYLPPNLENTAYPEVSVNGNNGYDRLIVHVDPSDPGTQLSVTNTAIWRGNFSSRIANYGVSVEDIRIIGGSGNDDLRLFFPGSAPNARPSSEAASLQTSSFESFNVLHTYFFDGSGGDNRLSINNSAGNPAITETVGSSGDQSGYANPDPAVSGAITFSQIGVLAYSQPIGGNLNISGYNSSDYVLLAGVLSLTNNTILENQPIGTGVGNLLTSFPFPSGGISYALVAGNGDTDNSRFSIVGGNALASNAVFDFETNIAYSIRVRATSSSGVSAENTFYVAVGNILEASVIGRGIFYNRSTSSVFGNGSGNPSNAIDTTKSALLPGQVASTANYTNYYRGLNGLFLDIANAPPFMPDHFSFATWNGIDTNGFVDNDALTRTMTLIPGGGQSGSTRVKIEFPDGDVKNTWLRITLSGDVYTDLASNDVFYFGNAVGDMYIGNVGTPTTVRTNATDTSRVRQNQSIAANSVGIENIFDLNKDGRVNATDTSIVRQNQANAVLQFFTAPMLILAPAISENESSILSVAPITYRIPMDDEADQTLFDEIVISSDTEIVSSPDATGDSLQLDEPIDRFDGETLVEEVTIAIDLGSGEEPIDSLDAAFASMIFN